jgi:hypothetical protein
MRFTALMVEPLERRELMAALWSGSVGEPVQAQECVQVQACVAECPGPVQEQLQTQTQTQQQDGTGPGPVQEPVQTQTQLHQQDGSGEGPIQDQLQTQEQTQLKLQDGSGDGPVQEQTQEQTQLKLQDGDCNCNCSVNDAAIESLVADGTDPPRQRSGDTAHPENGIFVRDRDGKSW